MPVDSQEKEAGKEETEQNQINLQSEHLVFAVGGPLPGSRLNFSNSLMLK